MIEIETAALVEQPAVLVEAVALALTDPAGQIGVARPLALGDGDALLQVGDIAPDAPVGAGGAGLGLYLLFLFRDRRAIGAGVGLVEVVEQPVGQGATGFLFHAIDIVLEDVAVVDALDGGFGGEPALNEAAHLLGRGRLAGRLGGVLDGQGGFLEVSA